MDQQRQVRWPQLEGDQAAALKTRWDSEGPGDASEQF